MHEKAVIGQKIESRGKLVALRGIIYNNYLNLIFGPVRKIPISVQENDLHFHDPGNGNGMLSLRSLDDSSASRSARRCSNHSPIVIFPQSSF